MKRHRYKVLYETADDSLKELWVWGTTMQEAAERAVKLMDDLHERIETDDVAHEPDGWVTYNTWLAPEREIRMQIKRMD